MPGPLLYLLYITVMKGSFELSLSLFENKNDVAVIISTFSFTMLGFLAAVITLIFAFSNTVALKRYKRKGHMEVFFFIYYVAIVSLIVTFFLAILGLSSVGAVWPLRASLMMVVNSFIQIGILTIIIVRLLKRALSESD